MGSTPRWVSWATDCLKANAQRIGLARVFLRNADLVLFDEPTSRLDALNEAIILRSIHELSKSEQNADKGQDVAVVLVSRRESAMRVADAVLNL